MIINHKDIQMKKFFAFIPLFIILFSINLLALSPYELNNSNMGKDFWFAIPQNEAENVKMPTIRLDIYCISYQKGTVTLSVPSIGFTTTKNIEPFVPVNFAAPKSETAFNWEVTKSEEVSELGVHVTSTVEVAVFVLSVKEISSEGFMVLPTQSWGTQYFNCSFTDLNEGQNNRAGGFLIVADQDETKIRIELYGIGTEDLKVTQGGRKIGDVINIVLNKGQTYMVRGNGRTRNFDLTGTKVTSEKPIGFISYHMRLMIPVDAAESRQFVAEMLPPVSQWGKDHISVEFNRKGTGDYFRLLASQPETKWSVEWYDIQTKQKVSNKSGTLAKAGDFFEYSTVEIGSGEPRESIKGLAHWVADKPVLLMQYAYSKPWDDDKTWKPVMVFIPPTEQYISSAIAFAPVASEYNLNDMTLFAIGDPKDAQNNLLKTIRVNDKEIPKIYPNNIPNTNVYWYRDVIYTGNGTKRILSGTKLAGYIDGFSTQNSFAWPLAFGTNKIDEPDQTPPVISINGDCSTGKFTVKIEDKRDAPADPNQKNQGISKIIFDSVMYNVEFDTPQFDPRTGVEELTFNVNVLDIGKNARMAFWVLDRAGNITGDTIECTPSPATLEADQWDAGEVLVGEKVCSDAMPSGGIRIRNTGSAPLELTSIEVKSGPFSISSPSIPALPMMISGSSVILFKSACFAPIDTGYFSTEVVYHINGGQSNITSTWMGYGKPKGTGIELSTDCFDPYVQPDPANSGQCELNYYMPVPGKCQVELFDFSGRKITEFYAEAMQGSNRMPINTGSLASGIYYIKISVSGTISFLKFIVYN